MINKRILTTFEAAALCSVSYNTIKNWIKRDLLPAYRTAGGHLRIKIEDLESFSKDYGIPMSGDDSLNRRTVLILDKGGTVSSFFNETFGSQQEKMDVRTTTDALEAGMLIESIKPDLVILNSSTPGFDGTKSCNLIRKSPALKHTKIALFNGSASNGGTTQTGADITFDNPVDRIKLHDFVEAALATKSGVRAKKRRKQA